MKETKDDHPNKFLFSLLIFSLLLISQLCMEVTLLSQPLLKEVVMFCDTASFTLLSAFEERGLGKEAAG
jgi:hypothetical protein